MNEVPCILDLRHIFYYNGGLCLFVLTKKFTPKRAPADTETTPSTLIPASKKVSKTPAVYKPRMPPPSNTKPTDILILRSFSFCYLLYQKTCYLECFCYVYNSPNNIRETFMKKQLFDIIKPSDNLATIEKIYDVFIVCTIVINLLPLTSKSTTSFYITLDTITKKSKKKILNQNSIQIQKTPNFRLRVQRFRM